MRFGNLKDLPNVSIYAKISASHADVAQLVEQRFCKPQVVSSILTVGLF